MKDNDEGSLRNRMAPLLRGKVFGLSTDSFYSNSLFIIIASFLSSALGLLFWIFAAKVYDKEGIGYATALISSASLIVLISRLGLDQSMTRYFSNGNRTRMFSSTMFITTLVALVLSIVFILTSRMWAPDLDAFSGWSSLFIVLVIVQSVVVTTTSAFVAMRQAKLQLIQNIIMGTRLLWLFPLVFLGALGILGSFIMALVIVLIFSMIFLFRASIRISGIDAEFVKGSFNFTVGNYVSSMLVGFPFLILPLIILNQLGANEAANYYMVYSYSTIVFTIPVACSTQLFVEGSHGEELRKTSRKAITASYLILLPVVFALLIWGGALLEMLGTSYAEGGQGLLKLFALSSLLIVPFQICYSIILVKRQMKSLLLISVINCVAILGLSCLFLTTGSLESIGYAWIAGYGVTNIFILIIMRKMT